MNAVAAGELGKASGTYMTARQLGGVFGLAIAVAVFAGAGSYASASAFGDGFDAAIAASAGFSLAGAIVAAGIPHRPRAAFRAPGRIEQARPLPES